MRQTERGKFHLCESLPLQNILSPPKVWGWWPFLGKIYECGVFLEPRGRVGGPPSNPLTMENPLSDVIKHGRESEVRQQKGYTENTIPFIYGCQCSPFDYDGGLPQIFQPPAKLYICTSEIAVRSKTLMCKIH